MSRLSPRYQAYIRSEEWKWLAAEKKREVGARYPDGEPRCEHCGLAKDWPDVWLEVNHLHYGTLGFESLADLEVLCAGEGSNWCHQRADETRRRGGLHHTHVWAPGAPNKRPWWRRLLG